MVDRLCNLNSAVYLKSSYLQAPAGVYFSGDFSILLWIQFNQLTNLNYIVNFSNNNQISPTDIVVILYNLFVFEMFTENLNPNSNMQIPIFVTPILKDWYHLSFVFKDNSGSIYLNGKLIGSSNYNMSPPNNVRRSFNYFGRGLNSDPNANAIIDEMKIYNSALTSDQLLFDYLASSSNGKFI